MQTVIPFIVLALLLSFLALNYAQLYSAWAIWSETTRLTNLARYAPVEFQNPQPVEDHFDGKLSDFWKFTTINGGGKVSNEMAWHAAAITFDQSLVIRHSSDPFFKNESPVFHKPAAEQYNNVSLVGGSGFRPSASRDVVLKFTAWIDEKFYGTAGVVFQPVGTLPKNGRISKSFDMFGFLIAGKESSLKGVNGPLCYLALKWALIDVKPIRVDTSTRHTYEIRLRWIDRTGWQGIIKVDDKAQCQMDMPAFGPVEVHAWSDNLLTLDRPRRWWQIAPAMDLKYQDGGDKRFSLGMIQIFEEAR